MTLDASERKDAARKLGTDLYASATATLNLNDLIAAVGSLDDAFDTVISTVPPGAQNMTIKQALIAGLPEPFKSNSTAGQKALVLAAWAFKEAGLI